MMMTIRATTSAATTPAMIATLPPGGAVGSDCRSVGDGVGSCVGSCVMDGGGAVTTPAMAAPLPPDGDVGSGCTSFGDDTGKEEMSGC